MEITKKSAEANELSTLLFGTPLRDWLASPGGLATLDENGKLDPAQIPPLNVAASITGTLNLTSLDSVLSAQRSVSNDNEAKLFIVADENGTYPTTKDAVIAPDSVVTALSLSSPDEGVIKLMTNWEAYYKVSGSYYSQNISRYLMDGLRPKPFRTGDLVLITKRKVSAVDFIAQFIEFSSIDVTSQLNTAQKLIWNSYKLTIGCSNKSDGDTIKTMITKDLIYGCTDNSNYTVVSSDGLITMYDCKVLTQTRPLPTFSGSFNSGNDCNLPGIYNSITLGRPAGSASGETYTLVVQPDGSHWAYSNTRGGHNFYRPTKYDEWVQIGIM